RGSLFARLSRRRSAEADESESVENGIRRHAPRAAADEALEPPVLPYGDEREPPYVAEGAPAPAPSPPVARPAPVDRRESRQVHAVPTNADMKRSRAVELFNASTHPRTVAGVARSLGAPFVVVRPSSTEGSIVSITAGWELCW